MLRFFANTVSVPSVPARRWTWLALLLLLAALPTYAGVSSPVELEKAIAAEARQTDKTLTERLAETTGGNEELALRFALLRHAVAAGNNRVVSEQTSRLLSLAAASDDTTRKAIYIEMSGDLFDASGEENQHIRDLHSYGQRISAEKMRQHLEDIQRNQQLQLEYMKHRAEMQMRITILLGICLVLTAVLAWSLWRIAISRREQALEDAMTGLKNRRFLHAYMSQETMRLQRNGLTALLLIADIDHFKQINDRWGHDMGDRVLVEMASTLRGCMRNSDVVVRWGGEEFVIVCPQSREVDAELICQRIRKRLREMGLSAGDGQELHVTISMGVALFAPAQTGEQWESVLDRADQSLYWVKQHGRDNWRLAEAPVLQQDEVAVS